MSTPKPVSRPWQAAFVAYCQGSPIDEIAQVFDIPVEQVLKKMASEGWAGLRARLPLATMSQAGTLTETNKNGASLQKVGDAGLLPATVAKLELINQNREANLAAFIQLREHAVEQIRALRDGTAKMDRLFHFKGSVIHEDAEPGPADWVNIATYLRTIADGTYRALGDFQSQEKSGQDAAAGASIPTGPAITIILPNVISAPREQRQSTAEVIDCQAVVAPTQPK